MTIMENETFGEVEFEQKELGTDGEATFSRRDLTPYTEFITALAGRGKGVEAKVKVATGEIKRDGKQGRGRGKGELADSKAFQEAANSLGYGLRISARHLTDGSTLLRMMIVPKRVFTDEQNANRERGQNKRRLDLAQARLAKANAALAANPNDAEAKALHAEATARITELETALSPAKAPAQKKA
jgi:hypothetical protein